MKVTLFKKKIFAGINQEIRNIKIEWNLDTDIMGEEILGEGPGKTETEIWNEATKHQKILQIDNEHQNTIGMEDFTEFPRKIFLQIDFQLYPSCEFKDFYCF